MKKYHLADSTRWKLHLSHLGKKASTETRNKMSISRMGHATSDATKEKLRQAALGRKHSEETKEKIRLARAAQEVTPKMLESLAKFRGENSLLWKGPAVGYRALHRWVEQRLGKPGICEHCNQADLSGHDIHWANKSGKYRRDLADWLRLCALCHKKYDRTLSINQ